MSRILCLDASTEACSVALLNDGEITERYQLAPRQHANLLLPMVDELLAASQLKLNQLDAIACVVGPGAFTGIRIGVSVAQGLAFGANLPTTPLSSLANLAQQAFDETSSSYCLSAIDARMNEVYFGGFVRNSSGLAVAFEEEKVLSPEEIDFSGLKNQLADAKASLIGSGWQAYEVNFSALGVTLDTLIPARYPKASASLKVATDLLAEGKLLSPELLQPVYLRNNVAAKKQVKI